MPQVKRKSDGQVVNMTDGEAVQAVQSGQADPVAGQSYTVKNAAGEARSVTSEQLVDPIRRLTPYTAEDDHRRIQEKIHDTTGSKVKATIGGGVSGLTLGFANPWKEDQEFNPGHSIAGDLAATVGTFLIPGAGQANAARLAAKTGGGIVRRGLTKAIRATPLGKATEAAARVAENVKGTGLLSRAGRTAIEGGIVGGLQGIGRETSHQLMDDDAEFSAEALISSGLKGAALGGGIGAGGQLLADGIGAGSAVLQARINRRPPIDEAEQLVRAEARAPVEVPDPVSAAVGRPPMVPLVSKALPPEVKLTSAVKARGDDLERLYKVVKEVEANPGLLQSSKLDMSEVQSIKTAIQSEAGSLKNLSEGISDPAVTIARDSHLVDRGAERLAKITDDVPTRWSDPEVRDQVIRARDKALDDIQLRRSKGELVSQAEEDAVRYASQLASGTGKASTKAAPVGMLGRLAESVSSRIPGARLIGDLGKGTAAVTIAENIVTNGVGSLTGMAAPIGAAYVGGKIVQNVFKEGGRAARSGATVASILDRTARLSDDREAPSPSTSRDPSRALRDMADRARMVTPQQVNMATVGRLSHLAGSHPITVQRSGLVSQRHHEALLRILDRYDPQATTPRETMFGRPLPSRQSARAVSDFVQVAERQENFINMALDGRLTPEAMAHAAELWPATVARARAELAVQLSQGLGGELPVAVKRSLELIMDSGSMGGPNRSTEYLTVMQESVMRGKPENVQTGMRAPTPVRTRPPAPSPAEAAAQPGSYKP